MTKEKAICRNCGKEFEQEDRRFKHCSRECRFRNLSNRNNERMRYVRKGYYEKGRSDCIKEVLKIVNKIKPKDDYDKEYSLFLTLLKVGLRNEIKELGNK